MRNAVEAVDSSGDDAVALGSASGEGDGFGDVVDDIGVFCFFSVSLYCICI